MLERPQRALSAARTPGSGSVPAAHRAPPVRPHRPLRPSPGEPPGPLAASPVAMTTAQPPLSMTTASIAPGRRAAQDPPPGSAPRCRPLRVVPPRGWTTAGAPGDPRYCAPRQTPMWILKAPPGALRCCSTDGTPGCEGVGKLYGGGTGRVRAPPGVDRGCPGPFNRVPSRPPFRRPAPPGPVRSPHLRHEAVRPRVLLVLEDDVGVVVGHQLPEALRPPQHFALRPPARSQRLLGDVGHELFVEQRGELPPSEPPPPHRAPARPAAQHRGGQQEGEQGEGERTAPGHPGALRPSFSHRGRGGSERAWHRRGGPGAFRGSRCAGRAGGVSFSHPRVRDQRSGGIWEPRAAVPVEPMRTGNRHRALPPTGRCLPPALPPTGTGTASAPLPAASTAPRFRPPPPLHLNPALRYRILSSLPAPVPVPLPPYPFPTPGTGILLILTLCSGTGPVPHSRYRDPLLLILSQLPHCVSSRSGSMGNPFSCHRSPVPTPLPVPRHRRYPTAAPPVPTPWHSPVTRTPFPVPPRSRRSFRPPVPVPLPAPGLPPGRVPPTRCRSAPALGSGSGSPRLRLGAAVAAHPPGPPPRGCAARDGPSGTGVTGTPATGSRHPPGANRATPPHPPPGPGPSATTQVHPEVPGAQGKGRRG